MSSCSRCCATASRASRLGCMPQERSTLCSPRRCPSTGTRRFQRRPPSSFSASTGGSSGWYSPLTCHHSCSASLPSTGRPTSSQPRSKRTSSYPRCCGTSRHAASSFTACSATSAPFARGCSSREPRRPRHHPACASPSHQRRDRCGTCSSSASSVSVACSSASLRVTRASPPCQSPSGLTHSSSQPS